MDAQVAKWGNSLAVRIPKVIADKVKFREGEPVELAVTEDGCILLRPRQKKITLENLVKGITQDNRHDETDWGVPEGKEVL